MVETTQVLSDLRCLLVLFVIPVLSVKSSTSGFKECSSFQYNARHESRWTIRYADSATNKQIHQPTMSECDDGFIQQHDALNHHRDSQHGQTQLTRRKLIVSSVRFFPAYLFFRANEALANEQSTSLINDEPTECRNGGIVSEMAVPGAYQQQCMDLVERTFLLKSTNDTITIEQGTGSAKGVAGRTGGRQFFSNYPR
eukprot:CCRYP_010262-RA/>CCRYP_010262-RA protein AED:0.13 eAED:0.13 QI:217/1/1/1/0.4/0.33/6/3715/197